MSLLRSAYREMRCRRGQLLLPAHNPGPRIRKCVSGGGSDGWPGVEIHFHPVQRRRVVYGVAEGLSECLTMCSLPRAL
jgi:hypothetical protein